MKLERSLAAWEVPRDVADLGKAFERNLDAAHRQLSGPSADFNRALVAHLALNLPEKLARRRLPVEVLSRVPSTLKRLLTSLSEEPRDGGYDMDRGHFLKDVRLSAGLMVACGAQDVDLRGRVGRRHSALLVRRKPLLAFTPLLGRPWLRPHTDTRNLDEFNEQGWENTYRRMAAILEEQPELVGMAAYSWFYDPQLDAVSPRLTYLRATPLKGGAILCRCGTSEQDIANATATSGTRRKLYESGEYTPVAYQLLWPRREMIAWAKKQKSDDVPSD